MQQKFGTELLRRTENSKLAEIFYSFFSCFKHRLLHCTSTLLPIKWSISNFISANYTLKHCLLDYNYQIVLFPWIFHTVQTPNSRIHLARFSQLNINQQLEHCLIKFRRQNDLMPQRNVGKRKKINVRQVSQYTGEAYGHKERKGHPQIA